MQKKVLAAAIGACLIAPAAMAEVTISGRLAVGLESYDVEGTAVPDAQSEMLVSDQSSSLVFSGKEDLGGGLSAFFRIDNRFGFDSGSFGATGNTGVGLEGSWGRLTIGRWDLHYNEMFGYESLPSGSLQTRVSGSVFSQVTDVGTVGIGTFQNIANGTRTPNVIMWDGSFGGGITARVAYSTSPFATEVEAGTPVDEGDAITAALRWSSGPLSVGASFWSAENETGDTEQDSVRAWAAYKWGNLEVAFGYDVSSVTIGGDEIERTAYAIPVRYTLDAKNSVYLGVAIADDAELNGADQNNTGATIWSIGYNHALSKNTHVGIYYTDLDNDDAATYNFFANGLSGAAPGQLGPGTDASQIYIGIAHLF